MNILIGNKKVGELLKLWRKRRCNFCVLYGKKKREVGKINKNTSFLKNICNKNVINNLDCLSVIENLKYVSEHNVSEDIIKNYINRIKFLNDKWSLNKIYFIFKTLMQYNLYDVVLLNKLENIISDIDILSYNEKAEIDPFENIYIIRITYVLHSFYNFNHANEQVVEKLLNILSRKLDYIIYHNNYFNFFFYKIKELSASGKLVKSVSLRNFNITTTRTNNLLSSVERKDNIDIADEISELDDIYYGAEWHRKKSAFVRNINFNEIYLILNFLKNVKYTNRRFLNRLKFVYYFNCIVLDKASENDYKYITLLFHFFYEKTDKHLHNIMKMFLLRHTDKNNIHDLVLVMMTVYYARIGKRYDDSYNSEMMKGAEKTKNSEKETFNYYSSNNMKHLQTDDILCIIESIHFLPNEGKRNLKSILAYICQYNSTNMGSFTEITYERVLKLLNRKYYEEEFEDKLGKKRDNISSDFKKENENCIKNAKQNGTTVFHKDRINELQSLSELIKICIYSLKDIDELYYLYLKKYVEFYNMETILNIMRSFVFVYNIKNETKKNYNKKNLDIEINMDIISSNLNNLTNLIIQIITTISLHRFLGACSIKYLSTFLYYIYQISNIFENKTFEELYLHKLKNYIDNIMIMKLRSIFRNKIKEDVNRNDIDRSNNNREIWEKYTYQVNSSNENYLQKSYLQKKNESHLNKRDEIYCQISSDELCKEATHLLNSGNNDKREYIDEQFKNDGANEIIEVFILLFNIYSKKGDNKDILLLILKILNNFKVENKDLPSGIYINLLNSFAKLKYRNLNLIETCLNKIDDNSEGLQFYEYTNLLISLSKLNIFGINLNIYDSIFLSKGYKSCNSIYCEDIKKIFLNEYNHKSIKNQSKVKIVYTVNRLLKKINESMSNFPFYPSYKIINIIPNILMSYAILGFTNIHFKNVNYLLECFHDYVFNYFKNFPSVEGNDTYTKRKNDGEEKDEVQDEEKYYANNLVTCMDSPSSKCHYWYFSEKNNIKIIRENTNGALYLPLQCVYQIYIFNIYFNVYVKYLFYSHKEDMKKKGVLNQENREENEKDVQGGSTCYPSNYLLITNVYIENNLQINEKPNYNIFCINNILSEKSIHILNNVIFFVKYVNNFYKKSSYDKYNLCVQFLNGNGKNQDQNEQLVEYIKKCHIHIKRDNTVMHSSSFHRDVFSTLLSLGVKNMKCEVPFLDGIYSVDIICIEINGNNHYYYNGNMKRSCENIDSLNLIKYYLLSKRYKLILVSYLEWNNLKCSEEKRNYMRKKILL
ncbi:hypothetical protein, conserved [Plasmodium malariae]|uniref:RAP domain-containing protein n=1 Tax=Plasmodium malariae TaxID=5858 RepID=A0A1A8W2M3_PLAMA|nr:hypothetical protein, conserved [Plasmodium malariae]